MKRFLPAAVCLAWIGLGPQAESAPRQGAQGTGEAQVTRPTKHAKKAERKGLRRTSICVLRRLDGSPWSKARIEFLSRLIPGAPGNPVADRNIDRVSGVADAKGRCRVKLLANREYEAWALEILEDGSYHYSTVASGVGAGSAVRLVQVGTRKEQRQSLTGLAAWKKRFPLQAAIEIGQKHCYVVHRLVEGAEDGKGSFLLPPYPGSYAAFTILDKEQRPILRGYVNPRGKAGKLAEIPVSPPYLLRFSVKNRRGQPLAGATLTMRPSYQFQGWTKVGETGKDGIGTAIAVSENPATKLFNLRIEAKGHANYFYRRALNQAQPGLTRKDSKVDFRVTLKAEGPVSGTLFWTDGRPAAGIPLSFNVWDVNSGMVTETQADGSFEFPGQMTSRGHRILAYLPPEEGRVDPALDLAELQPVILVAFNKRTKRYGSIFLDGHVRLDLRVFRPDGSPARAPRVLLAEPQKLSNCYQPVRLLADRRGQLSFLSPRMAQIEIAAGIDAAVGITRQSLLPGKRKEDPKTGENGKAPGDAASQKRKPRRRIEVKLRLRDPLFIEGRALDLGGKPVIGARIYANPFGGFRNALDQRLLSQFHSQGTRSNSKGIFRVWVPFSETNYYLYGNIQVGKQWFSTTTSQTINVEKKPVRGVEIELNLPAKWGAAGAEAAMAA